MRLSRVVAVIGFLVALAGSAHAQPALETQVPLDDAGHVPRIDADMARRLNLFTTEYPGFETARLWQAADSSYALEVVFHRDGRIVRERKLLSGAETARLRQSISEALQAGGSADARDNSGRTGFLVGTTLIGVGLYSWGVPVAADMDGSDAVGIGLVTAAMSFFVPYVATRSSPVTPGIANLSLYGGTRGIVHGAMLVEAVDSASSSDARICGAVAGSVLEGVAGYLWARSSHMNAGDAHGIAVGCDLGFLYGLGLSEALDGNHDNFLDPWSKQALNAGALGGAATGVVAGKLLGDRWQPRWGDGETVRMGSFVGAFAGTPFSDDPETALAGALAGSAVGFAVGLKLVEGRDFSVGQSILIDTGAIAGTVLGFGTAYVIDSDNGDEQMYLAAGAIGAAGGYAITYLMQRNAARAHDDARSGLHLEISPQAAMALLRSGRATPAGSMASIHYQF
jgi:hypothetical protein